MTRRLLALFFIVWPVFLCGTVFAQEKLDDKSSEKTATEVIDESVQEPIVTVQSPPAPNEVINQSGTTLWWKALDPGLTLLGIVIAAWMIVWQMGRQHRSSLALQTEISLAEMRKTIFRELQERISMAVSAESAVSGYVRLIPLSLENYREQVNQLGIENVFAQQTVPQRIPMFNELNAAMLRAAVDVIFTFENYAIAIPEFKVFQTALNSAMHDAREAFYTLHRALVTRLPLEMPEQRRDARSSYHIPPPPKDNDLAEIQRLVNEYIEATNDIGCYLCDLNIESQNTLLKDLYPDQEAPLRVPINPKYKVITSEKSAELQRYFHEETAWGQTVKTAESLARAELTKEKKENHSPIGKG